ncbi:MAG: WD40 repeat domain-containing protein [Nocardioides sp.]
MRIRIQRRGLVPAIVIAVVGTVLLYLGATYGVAAWHASRTSVESGVGTLPSQIENAPDTVATTDEYGPVGSVSVVFAGTEAHHGLLGSIDDPWIAMSAQSGEYRALLAPDLPDPVAGAVTTSPDGNRLAWVGDSGVVVYDTITGDSEELPVPGVSAVGAFAPDGSMLLTYAADGLAVVDVTGGEVLATTEAPPESVARAAWRPDGSAVDVVTGTQLTTVALPSGDVTQHDTELPETSSLAWSPTGDRLVSMQEESGANPRLFVSEVSEDGALGSPTQIDSTGFALDRLLGFSGERTISVVALQLQSGSLEQIFDLPLDGRSASPLTALPSPGENWAGTPTLSVATDNLYQGSSEFPDRVWPWSYTSRLAGCILVSLFLFGLYVTRRPRRP